MAYSKYLVICTSIALALALQGCPPSVDAVTLRSCLAATTCGECMGARPRGVACGWCQTGNVGHCIPSGVGSETPPACGGPNMTWFINVTAPSCPAIAPCTTTASGPTPDPNQ